ncbi:MAG: phenylalanine--tRNA ligase subunit beta [Rickettsiales bacterium]|jgi:phenylalanyl-tRNA synthetase beta chain|nr:phenylalanine--tRNA ligase subunit beta [Rickettsiales bacterium]
MKWTYDWLLDYLDTTATAEQIADKLTEIGLEIEGLTTPVSPIVAKIVECSDIPDTHLHLLSVDDGAGTRQVVCGAPNVRVGLVGVLARPGCEIEGNIIKVGKIRGHESNGMMCSERELGLGDNHEGIVELDAKKYKIGAPFGNVSADAVFDAKILPNRPYYLGVRGIARDLAASGIGKYKNKKFEVKEVSGARKAVIKNKDRCPVYNFAEIKNIKIAPSDPNAAARLSAIGINPKNAPVDATNYVCFDLGQPLHCFDADEIKGDIVIRNAADGEKFTDLFDTGHILVADDLVITDADGILALAGVVGGRRGMTTGATKNIILESAYFEPLGIRKTRRRLNLGTDASFRYERGIDPLMTAHALAMAAGMITKECGGEIVSLGNDKPAVKGTVVKYDPEMFLKKTGVDLSEKTQREILEKLDYKIDPKWSVTPPSWRVDVDIPEAVISDLIRFYGYGNVETTGLSVVSTERSNAALETGVSEFFARDRHLVESKSYGFGNIWGEKQVSARPNVKIANPIADYLNTARNSLIPNMLDAIAANENRGYPDLAMFEVGTVFDGPNPGGEHTELVIARTGAAGPRHWLKRGRPVDIFDVKADLLAFFERQETRDKRQEIRTETDNAPQWAHPYRYGRLVLDGKVLGEFGELHPKLARAWRLKTTVVLGLIENPERDKGQETRDKANAFESNFQPITRDFSFSLDGDARAEDIVSAARSADGRVGDVLEFDFYENSIAFTVTILPDKNLSDKEILEIQNKVISAVEKLGAKIRDK